MKLALILLAVVAAFAADKPVIAPDLALELSLASNAANAAEAASMLAIRKAAEAAEAAVQAGRQAERASAIFASVRERAKAACGGVDPVSDGKTITCPAK